MIKYKMLYVFQYFLIFMWISFILLPIATIINVSLKTREEFYHSSPISLPKSIYFENFKNAITNGDLISAILTTSILILFTVIVTTLISSSVAYVVERFDFKLKKFILLLFSLTSLIPMIVMQIFIFQILNKINLYDKIIGIALLYSVSDIVIIYVFREQIKKIPISIDKSSIIFGSNYIKNFFYIILPCLKESIMVVVIFKTIAIYNDYYLQFLYLPTKTTLSTYLFQFIGIFSTASWPEICATVIVTFCPMLIIILLAQITLKNKISNIDLK